jgi:hypothetical protein
VLIRVNSRIDEAPCFAGMGCKAPTIPSGRGPGKDQIGWLWWFEICQEERTGTTREISCMKKKNITSF